MATKYGTPPVIYFTSNPEGNENSTGCIGENPEPGDTHANCACECADTGAPRTAIGESETSSEPVRYMNGELRYSEMDLGVGGYGHAWGHTRIYANQLSHAVDLGHGAYWLIKEHPYLIQKSDGEIVYVRGVNEVIWFTESGGNYTPRYDIKASLTHDGGNDEFELVMPDGEVFLFHDFDQTSNPQGAFKSHTTVGGQTTSVQSFTDGRIEEVQRSVTVDSDTTIESFYYEYDGNGQLQYVTLRRKVNAGSWSNIRRVEYSYYGSSEDYGNEGDLKTVKRQLDNSGWVTLDTSYYRYYKDGDSNGFAHGMKFIIGPEAYRRLDDAVANPLTATDAQVDDYADHYFEYDESKRVTKEVTRGGTHTTTFAYAYSGNANGPNNWHYKTVETKSGGETVTVYTNHLGQVLLRELKDGSDSWVRYIQYNSQYLPVLRANPSAFTSYDDSEVDLDVSLKASSGRIDVVTYYSTTSGVGVEDYPEYEKVKEGATGTEIKLKKYEYTSQTANSITVYPVSKITVYRNDNGTGAIETSFSYSWHSGTLQMEERVTTLPVISTAQNGSNSANSRTERFDSHGNLIWMKDERGFITRHVYDSVQGVMTQMIQDVDHTQVSDEPSGWTTPASGGLHLVSDFEYDDLGRQTQSLGPAHEIDISSTATSIRRASWTVYDDEDREVLSASGYGSGTGHSTYTLVNPVSISKMDQAGRTTEQIQATRASTSGKLLSSDTFAQSAYVRWSTMSYGDEGNLEWSRAYHDIPSSGAGSSGTNYNQSDFEYSAGGEHIMSQTPGGTITRTVFDVRGNAEKVYVGTDDTGATESDPTNGGAGGNNMKLVTQNEYDDDNDGGDNHLTEVTQHVDASTTRVTSYSYDFRGRQTDIDGEIDFYQISTYDNLGQVTRVDRKDTTSGGTLIARSETKYDDLGRVYQSIRYAVDPSTGTVGNSLTDNTWYDESGNVIKQHPAGSEAFNKSQYDGLGRAEKTFVGYDTDETAYADADDVTGDTIFEQNETEFDEAGNVIRTILRRRFHDATGTGELTTPSGSQPKARVSYVAMYPDALGRAQGVANYGTNGGSSHTRATTIPTRSDDILVTETFYDDSGQTWKTVDPAGRDDRVTFDDAGRRLSTIENYTNGDPTSGNSDEDRTVAYTYNADGQVETITAKQQSTSDDQVTTYVYGTTLTDSDVARRDLLRAEIYPDSDDVASPLGDGTDATYDRIEFKYNRAGQRKEMKDQNGTVHAYDYDKLGRKTHDRVTTVGTDIDNAVLRLSRTYEVRGLLEKATSYDNATVGSGNVVNEVLREYNDLAMLEKEYQEHEGAKDGSTLYVGYNYDESNSGGEFTKGLRPTSMRYPNGRLIHYTYGSAASDADNLNRLNAIKDDNAGSPGNTISSYAYIGRSMIVIEDYEEPDVRLDYHGGTSGMYAGFDRFDRVVDQRWYDYGSSADVDRYKYGYDRASNRLWRENTVSKALGAPVYLDEYYTYDGLNRLKTFDRGQLNGTNTGITGTPSAEEDWTLDPVGNWSGYERKTSGTTDIYQSRSVNTANEISNITETTGPTWADPVYDRAGNMTSVPKPVDLTASFDCTFDAWNRLVKVDDGSYTIGVYEHDALRRRVKKQYDSAAPDSPAGIDTYDHDFFNSSWQLLESRNTNTESDQPESLQAKYQYLWSPRYVDAVILRDENIDTDWQCDDGRMFFCQDAAFTLSVVLDEVGDRAECVTTEPHGHITYFDGQWGNAVTQSALGVSVGLTGRIRDRESGLSDFRHRVMHHQLGLFCQRDSNGYVDGQSLYAAYFAPHNVDPTGLEKKCSVCCPIGGGKCANAGWIYASDVFLHKDRTERVTDPKDATGIGFALHFRERKGQTCCSCDAYRFVQIVRKQFELAGGRIVEQIKVDISDGNRTPFYDEVGAYGTGEHDIPEGFPGDSPVTSTISIYDRPDLNGPLEVGQVSYRWTSIAFLFCIKNNGRDVLLLSGVSYSWLKVRDTTGNQVVQHVGPTCTSKSISRDQPFIGITSEQIEDTLNGSHVDYDSGDEWENPW